MRLGFTLFDFLVAHGIALNALPPSLTRALETISLDVTSETDTASFFRWEGTLPAEEFLQNVLGGTAVGIEKLSWRYTIARDTSAVPGGEVENPGLARELRVDLAGVRLQLPKQWGLPLFQADEIPARGTDISHLRRHASGERSALVGDLAFRLFQQGSQMPRFGLAGDADTFSAFDDSGAIAQLRLDLAAAVFSDKEDGFGVVVEGIQIDGSDSFTPPEIAAGDPAWKGFRLDRVGLFLPHSVPIFGSLSLVADEFLIPTEDTPGGLQGKITVETGRVAGTGATIRFTQHGLVFNPTQSLPVERLSGSKLNVSYQRFFDDNNQPVPISITAQSPVPEGVWQLWRDGVLSDTKSGGQFGPFVPGPDDELRYIRLARDETGPEFRLLARPDETEPKGTKGDFPAPAQVFVFSGVGRPAGPMWQINIATESGEKIDSVAYVTGTVADLSSLVFSLGQEDPIAETPQDLNWSIWAEGTLPGKGQALHDPAGAPTFQWDGWRDGTTVSVMARFGDGQSRRLLMTPRPDGPLMLGHNQERTAAQPRITVVANGAARLIAGAEISQTSPWRLKQLDDIQNKAFFGLGVGKVVDPRPLRADDTFEVEAGKTLLVPTVYNTGKADVPAVPASPILSKRVLLMEYDTPKPLIMLNDGFTSVPENSLVANSEKSAMSADQWIAKSGSREPSSGPVWPKTLTGTAAHDAADAAAADMLVQWISAQKLDPGVPVDLFVIAHTSPEGTRAHNMKLAGTERLVRGEKIARAAIEKAENALAPNALTVTLKSRAEHDARIGGEPDYSDAVLTSTKASAGQPQQVKPGRFARLGQIGELDAGGGDITTDLWIGKRGNMHDPHFLIERNVTFILKGQSMAVPAQPSPQDTRIVPVLVPGGEPDPVAPVEISAQGVATPWRMRAEMVWDAPRYQDSDDLMPLRTKVELTLPRTVLPGVAQSDLTSFSVMGQVLRDRQADETEVTLGVSGADHPEGLMEFSQEDVGSAAIGFAMFGPAILRALTEGEDDPALPEEDAQDGLARGIVAGLSLAGAALVTSALKDGRIVWTAARLSATVPVGRAAFAVDYLSEANISADEGIKVFTTEPIAFSWTNVGINVDWRPETPEVDLTGTAAYYHDARVEIVSSGRWTIEGILGDLVDVRDLQFEKTSAAVSARLVPTKPLGLLQVDAIGLSVRWSDAPERKVSVHLSEVAATLDVKDVITAEGYARFDDTSIRGTLGIDIPPAKIAGSASLAIENDPAGTGPAMVHLEAEISFASPIPIGTTGLSLNGVAGRFVANGERALDDAVKDIVARELDWGRKPTAAKYRHRTGQYGIGLGVLLGTTPDIGFALNAKGMLTLGFPDLEAVVSADIKLVERRAGPVSEDSSTPPAGADILALVVLNDQGVTLAAEGNVTIPAQMKAHIPIGAHFPFGPGDFFIHLGSDDGPDRPGGPITATIYPGLLDVQGWAFVMIREGGIDDLGGPRADDLHLTGFSVGVGLGIDLDKKYGPFQLNAAAHMIAGVGFDPLMVVALLQVDGSMDFFVASVHVSAQIGIRFTPEMLEIDGKIKGKVSLFWFDIEGTARITERVGGTPQIADAPSPIKGIRFTDDRDRILFKADPSGGAVADEIPVDAAINLEFFPSPLIKAVPGFTMPSGIEANWVGSTGLRYGYEITEILLERVGGQAGSNVSHTSVSGLLPASVIAATDAQEGQADAGRALRFALMSNDPVPWVGNLSEGSTTGTHVIDKIVTDLCEPAPRPRDMLFGVDMAQRSEEIWSARSRGPIPNSFKGTTSLPQERLRGFEAGLESVIGVALPDDGALDLTALRSALAGTAFSVQPMQRVDRQPGIFPAFPQGGLILPAILKEDEPFTSLPIQMDLAGQVLDPVLTLLSDRSAGARGSKDQKPQLFCPSRLKPSSRPVKLRSADRVEYKTRGKGFTIRQEDAAGQNPVTFGGGAADQLEVTFPKSGEGFEFELEARTTVFNGAVSVSLHDENGAQIWSDQIRMSRGRFQEVIRAPQRSGARSLRIMSFRAQITVRRVCQITRLPQIVSPRPRIFGIEHTGRLEEWEVSSLPQTGGPTAMGALRWQAKPESHGKRWRAILFDWMGYGWLAFETLEALSVATHDASSSLEARRASRAAAFSDRAAMTDTPLPNPLGVSGDVEVLDTVPASARPPLLVPGAAYRLTIKSRAAIWQMSEESETPPQRVADAFDGALPPGVGPIQTLDDVVVNFTTAPASAALDGVTRSFERALPDDPRGAHLTDDPLAVIFTSTIVPELIDMAGATLKFRLRRTDPRGGGTEIPSADIQVTRTGGNRDTWPGQQGAFVDALAKAAPCVTGTPTQGETMILNAPLEPDANYLFDIFAQTVDGSDLSIGQSRFRTSRYAGPAQQLREMGLVVDAPDLITDRLLAVVPQPGNGAPSDLALEAVARGLGMDPEPSLEPVAEALWVFEGVWKLAGLYLSSPEALERHAVLFDATGISATQDRLSLGSVALEIDDGTIRMRLAQRDAQGARWIFALDTPQVIKGSAEIRVEMTQSGHHWVDGVLRARPGAQLFRAGLRSLPLIAEIEGLT